MIIFEQSIEKLECLVANVLLVFHSDKLLPWFARKSCKILLPREQLVKLLVQRDIIFVQILKKVVCSKHLCNNNELVIIILAVKEGLLSENLS